MNLIENLKWRYATKKFDPTKKVPAKKLAYLKEAVQLSVSSYGLQLYKVLIIEDDEVRKKLKAASWDQSQITDASQLFVFCHYNERKDEHIDAYIHLTAETQNIPVSTLSGYGDFMKNSLSQKTDTEWRSWSKSQTYLALSNLLMASAELKIDACPMEGFDPAQYSDILNLEEQGLSASVLATVGYRSNEDKTQFRPKVRKPFDILFEEI